MMVGNKRNKKRERVRERPLVVADSGPGCVVEKQSRSSSFIIVRKADDCGDVADVHVHNDPTILEPHIHTHTLNVLLQPLQ